MPQVIAVAGDERPCHGGRFCTCFAWLATAQGLSDDHRETELAEDGQHDCLQKIHALRIGTASLNLRILTKQVLHT
jgi:hypothetical protein